MKDAFSKGRVQLPENIGENNPQAQLNEKEILEVRERNASSNYTHAELGALYGIARSTITNIVNLRTWKHLKKKDD